MYIYKENEKLYHRQFGKALNPEAFDNLLKDLKKDAFGKGGKNLDIFDYYKYRVAFATEKDLELLIIFITGLTDNTENIKKELIRCKKEFLNLFQDMLQTEQKATTFEMFDPTIDSIHRNLRPKISLVGFSGVGKTTITKLIKAEEIPMKHIPTITGDIATIKIGKLHFHLWDFAGQEQFSYLWNNFIKGSDAVLLITDSTLENVEKSKFFLELIKEQAPHAHTAVIGNKQDLPEAIKPEQIEKILGLKAYKMVATDPGNRDKMIQIIADILDMNAEVSPLLKPLMERDKLTEEAEKALEENRFMDAAKIYERIADLCIELGDDSYGQEFYNLAKKIRISIKKIDKKEKIKPEEEVRDEKLEKTAQLTGTSEVQEKPSLPKFKAPKPKVKPLPSISLKKPEKLKIESPQEPKIEQEQDTQIEPPHMENKAETTQEEQQVALKINIEEFKVKEPLKKVVHVPSDAKEKLKTSAYAPVQNVEQHLDSNLETSTASKSQIKMESSPEIKVKEKTQEKRPIKKEGSKTEEVHDEQKKNLEKTLLDLKIKKANISKMSLEIEMQELIGELTVEEAKAKLEKIKLLDGKIDDQMKEIQNLLENLE
ncbi:MAG: ADP-ribosylation factor-like protein [Promethearchaeota archaeon]